MGHLRRGTCVAKEDALLQAVAALPALSGRRDADCTAATTPLEPRPRLTRLQSCQGGVSYNLLSTVGGSATFGKAYGPQGARIGASAGSGWERSPSPPRGERHCRSRRSERNDGAGQRRRLGLLSLCSISDDSVVLRLHRARASRISSLSACRGQTRQAAPQESMAWFKTGQPPILTVGCGGHEPGGDKEQKQRIASQSTKWSGSTPMEMLAAVDGSTDGNYANGRSRALRTSTRIHTHVGS